jgi:TrpR-related protein YerC/YecD
MANDIYLLNKDARELYKAIQSLKTDEECKNFLRDLLTETEMKESINRWKVVRMLDQKIPYEEITNATGMSSTTIARISKWLQKGMGGYRLILNRIK